MQNTRFKKTLSFILCAVLIAAIALTATGCNDSANSPEGTTTTVPVNATQKGEGETDFYFTVTDGDGKETSFLIHTDKTTVGEALLELGLIAGDDGAYGIYVKTVNGITVDYDKDKKYWAFYENGKYAAAGVDKTNITKGAVYSFKVEK